MNELKKFFTNKTVMIGLVVAVILFVLYSNKDSIKAWFEPKPSSDKSKDKDKDEKPASNNATPPAGTETPPAGTPPAGTPPKLDYNKILDYKSDPMKGDEVKIMQKILNREIAYLKAQPTPILNVNQLQASGLPDDAKLTIDGVFGTKTSDYMKKLTGATNGSLYGVMDRVKATTITSLFFITPN